MLQLHPIDAGSDHDVHVDVSFRRADSWLDLPYPESSGGNISLLLFGDETDGPFAVLGSTTPTEMESPRGPAHGHESDSWRISLIGSSPMGNESYGPGEFRWQLGGRPYGADGYASGPDGGYHLVMFGDRRGFATQPVKKDLVEQFAMRDRGVAALFGIDIPDHYPTDARGIATTLGHLDKAGKVNGSFDHADGWEQVAPGVKASAGVMGHRVVGPLLYLARAAAGAEVLPAVSLDTEVLVMAVRGSCTIGDRRYEQGDVRLQRRGGRLPAIVAGETGADVCVVVADRSALRNADTTLLGSLCDRLVASLPS